MKNKKEKNPEETLNPPLNFAKTLGEFAVEINGLQKKFGNFGIDVTFSLPKGSIMGFVGKNGAGKTTTIKAILNMLNRDGGEIKIFGLDNLEHEAQIKQKIGVVMDSPFYEENWTLAQVGRVLEPFYAEWDNHRFNKMLNDFSLDPNKKIKELSRGMKMKIMVAAALAHNPDLLILDEPTGGLDAVARDELVEILKSFIGAGNKSILFSTHITSDLEKIADYITFINNGKIVHSDTKYNLLEKYVMVKGKQEILDDEQKRIIVGFDETKSGFEGMIDRGDIGKMPKAVVTEPCTLDDIVVRFNKEGGRSK